MKRLKLSMLKTFLAVLATGLVTLNSATAAVIDFESATTSGCQVNNGGSVGGFTLGAYNGSVGAGFNSTPNCNGIISTAHSGTKFILNFNSVVGQLTKDTGTFTLNSLWVHADERTGASTVRFRGLDGNGGNVLFSEDVAISSVWQQVSFSGWDNIKTFTWDSITPASSNIAIDDFTFNQVAVPEPAAILLVGLGLAALSLTRRKRKN